MRRKGVLLLLALSLVLVMGWSMLQAQEEAPSETKPEEDTQGYWYLYRMSMPEGAIITLLSMWMIAVILAGVLTLRHGQMIPPELVEQVDDLLKKKQAKAALEACQASDSLVGKMMTAGISRVGRGFQPAMDYVGDVGQEEAMKLQHKLSYLSVIGAISPMLGLMGTVRGMIRAFEQLSVSGAQPSPAQLSGSIQLALVTTFEGLVVAVPALFAYSLFRNHLARTVTEADMVVAELMSRFQGVTSSLSRVTKIATAGQPTTDEATPPPDDKPPTTEL